jgi:hypothetical protein
MYPVCEDCRLGRESVYLFGRAGRKPSSFFLFAVGREVFLWGVCTSLFGWHFTVNGLVRSSAWFSSCDDGAHPRAPGVTLALVMLRGLLADVFFVIVIIVCVVEMFPHSSL